MDARIIYPLSRIAARLGFFGALARLVFGQRIAAVMALTWKAAFRFRLFIVVAVLLLGAVVALPIMIKDDGTAQGFTQILITYTLTAIASLLGLSTLWLACGSVKPPDMNKEIDEETDKLLKERLAKNPVTTADLKDVRKQIRDQIKG